MLLVFTVTVEVAVLPRLMFIGDVAVRLKVDCVTVTEDVPVPVEYTESPL